MQRPSKGFADSSVFQRTEFRRAQFNKAAAFLHYLGPPTGRTVSLCAFLALKEGTLKTPKSTISFWVLTPCFSLEYFPDQESKAEPAVPGTPQRGEMAIGPCCTHALGQAMVVAWVPSSHLETCSPAQQQPGQQACPILAAASRIPL